MTVCWEGRIKPILTVAFSFIVLFLGSCTDKEDSVGGDLVNQRNPFTLGFDTPTLTAFTCTHDSFPTASLPYYMVGTLNDPEIGTTHAQIMTQYVLPYEGLSFDTVSGFSIDSIVLQLPYATAESYYGDKAYSQHIQVYELEEELLDSPYYSNRNYAYSTLAPVGEFTGSFAGVADSVTITSGTKSVKIAPHFRIRLDNLSSSIKDRFLAGSQAGYFATQANFKKAFKGLAIVPVDTNPVGTGCLSYIHLNNSAASVVIYYKDSLKVEFPLKGGYHGNRFKHNNLPSVQVQPKNSTVHSDVNFLQPGAGLTMRITMPYLLDLVANKKITITGAELVLTAKAGTNTTPFTMPPRIFISAADSLGKDAGSGLNTLSLQVYGGFLEGNTRYRMNVFPYVQSILNEYYRSGRNVNYGFNLYAPIANPVTGQRVVFDTRRESGNFKLNLTYSVIK